ncbi:hypothetical protein K2Y11_02140 [bacterium]|nr:hypothetical protein [bacterium]
MRYFLDGMFGPFVTKEMIQLSRRPRTYVARILVGLAILFGLMLVWTPWKVGFFAAKELTLQELADLSFMSVTMVGSVLFVSMSIFPYVHLHDAFSRENELGTLELLQMTDLTDGQIIKGKYLGVILTGSLSLLLSAPILIACQLMGGVDTMLVLQILSISELIMIASASGAIYASVFYLHSRFERTMIWLISFYGLALLILIGAIAFNTLFFFIFGNPEFFNPYYVAGITAAILQSILFVQGAKDCLPLGESDHLRRASSEWCARRRRKETRLIDIETVPLLKLTLYHPWSDANFLWIFAAMLGLFLFDPTNHLEDLPRVILNIGCRCWVILTPLLCIHTFQRRRPGIWGDLLLAPMTNRTLLAKYLYFGIPALISLWIPPLLFTLFALPFSSATLGGQTLVFASLGIWGATTSWLAGICKGSHRLAIWGPVAFLFVVLMAYPMLATRAVALSNSTISMSLLIFSIGLIVCFTWANTFPTTLTVILLSVSSLLFFTSTFSWVVQSKTNVFHSLSPFTIQPKSHSIEFWEYSILVMTPVVAVTLTCCLVIYFVARNLDRITERVEQRNHHVR